MILTGPEIHNLIEKTRRAREARQSMGAALEEGQHIDDVLPLPALDINPFDPDHLGPNSFDVTLGPELLVYKLPTRQAEDWPRDKNFPLGTSPYVDAYLDPEEANPVESVTMPAEGMILRPGRLYLGATVEKTKCAGVVPWLDGRSSCGRLGLSVHVTAGRGDDGFGMRTPEGCCWTLEMTVVHSVRVRPGMRIGQISFFYIAGKRKPYQGKYINQTDGRPVESRMHQDKR